MVKDLKYIVKRVIIGTLIAFLIMALKGQLFTKVHALEYTFTNSCTSSSGYDTSTCGASVPQLVAFADTSSVSFQGVSLQDGHTYSINYYIILNGKNVTVPSGIRLDVGNGTSSVRAYPDRNEFFNVSPIGSNNYAVSWGFELDVTGNFNTAWFGFTFTSNYGGDLYRGGPTVIRLSINDLTQATGDNSDIINNDNANTQQIINNNTNNTSNIINNNNSNTENIINNQNENSQQVIESQNVCQNIDSTVAKNGGYLNASGVLTGNAGSGLRVSNFISINKSTKIKVLQNHTTTARTCFYDDTQTVISCITANSMSSNQFLTIPSNAKYVRFTINYVDNRPQFEVCNNGNQAVNDSINNLNDSINDDTGLNNSELEDLFGDIETSDTPISDLLTMPLTLINAYIDGLDSTCTPYNLGSLLGTSIILPCIDLESYLGSSLWSTIDLLFCIFLCYNIGMFCIQIYDSITSLRDGFDSIYTPRHARPLGKHTSEVE